MKKIEIDEELYQYIAGQTKHIGEDASTILRRLLKMTPHASHNIHSQPPSNKDDILTRLLSDKAFVNEKSIINRFLLLLSTLYQYDAALFSISAASLHGSKRQYLAQDKTSLEISGRNTKPREIIGTPYWVISNTNTDRKIHILESIMNNMKLPADKIKLLIAAFKAPIAPQ
ncbi:hypothetical protein PT273_06950 [Orbaceae bacterium ESL0727]|nr:hypothetical protein [Orbaceae bacterium ESL0727]